VNISTSVRKKSDHSLFFYTLNLPAVQAGGRKLQPVERLFDFKQLRLQSSKINELFHC